MACALALWRTDYDPTLWWKVKELEHTLNETAAETLFLQNYAERLSHAIMAYPRDSRIREAVNNCFLTAVDGVEDW